MHVPNNRGQYRRMAEKICLCSMTATSIAAAVLFADIVLTLFTSAAYQTFNICCAVKRCRISATTIEYSKLRKLQSKNISSLNKSKYPCLFPYVLGHGKRKLWHQGIKVTSTYQLLTKSIAALFMNHRIPWRWTQSTVIQTFTLNILVEC